jgi:GT2 family glycosyltransferase
VDDDVVVAKDWLQTAMDIFRAHSDYNVLLPRIEAYGKCPGEGWYPPITFSKRSPGEERLGEGAPGYGVNIFISRAAFNTIRGFDERFGPGTMNPCREDWDLLYRARRNGYPVRYDPHIVVYHDNWKTWADQVALDHQRWPACMAAGIKSWSEVGGPALREVFATMTRHFFHGFGHLARRRFIMVGICFKVVWYYLLGVPLGIRLAMEGRSRNRG